MDMHSNGNAANPAITEEGSSVKPAAFKALVGRGHAEFQSNRQQAGLIDIIVSEACMALF
jgi:uncharacterized UBP type Zn finger protein